MTKIQPDSVRGFRHDPLLLGSDADLNKLFLAVLLRLPALHARNSPLRAVVLKSGNPIPLTCNANVITVNESAGLLLSCVRIPITAFKQKATTR